MTDTGADTPPTGGGHVTVTLTQAAAARGVSERTVRRWIAKGKLPAGWAAVQTPDGLAIDMADTPPTGECPQLNAVADMADTVSPALWERIAALEAELERTRGDLETAQRDLSEARDREAWLRQRVEKAEVDRDRADEERRELVARIPPALPPAPEERLGRPWWRLW